MAKAWQYNRGPRRTIQAARNALAMRDTESQRTRGGDQRSYTDIHAAGESVGFRVRMSLYVNQATMADPLIAQTTLAGRSTARPTTGTKRPRLIAQESVMTTMLQ